MRKLWKRVGICAALSALIWCGGLLLDRKTLNQELIRFHVVANSDSEVDQKVKLRVRDAVLQSLEQELRSMKDVDAARTYLQENLPQIKETADRVLELAGFDEKTLVSLCEETFDTRYYDTFSLPAGVYQALRITIGEGNGQNWWCVAFPSLCFAAVSEEFEVTAVSAGFSEELAKTLSGKEPRQLRFFMLDVLGTLENRLFSK